MPDERGGRYIAPVEAFLTELDAVSTDEVSAACLALAGWLSERGDPESEGWLALGRLGKVPRNPEYGSYVWFGSVENARAPRLHVLANDWFEPVALTNDPSRSVALRTAAKAL